MDIETTLDWYDDKAVRAFRFDAVNRGVMVDAELKKFNGELINGVRCVNDDIEFQFVSYIQFKTPQDKMFFLLRWS